MDPILAELSASLQAAKSVEQLTRPLLDMLGAVTGLESTYLTSIDPDEDQQHVRYARNVGALQIPEGLSVPWSDTLCKRALEEGRMSTSDVGACWPDSDAARQLGIQTYVSTPIRTDDGLLLGTLCGASASRQSIAPQAEEIMRLFSSVIANFLEREQLVAELRTANTKLMAYALTDPLTGLPNRRALQEMLPRALGRARRLGRPLAVLFLDLDGLKRVNDEHGHPAGDALLCQFARRLRTCVRETDTVSRLAGDEFVVVLEGLLDAEADARAVGAKIIEAASQPFELASGRIEVGTSIGLCVHRPGEPAHAEALIAAADHAMYAAKRAGRGRIVRAGSAEDTPGPSDFAPLV